MKKLLDSRTEQCTVALKRFFYVSKSTYKVGILEPWQGFRVHSLTMSPEEIFANFKQIIPRMIVLHTWTAIIKRYPFMLPEKFMMFIFFDLVLNGCYKHICKDPFRKICILSSTYTVPFQEIVLRKKISSFQSGTISVKIVFPISFSIFYKFYLSQQFSKDKLEQK